MVYRTQTVESVKIEVHYFPFTLFPGRIALPDVISQSEEGIHSFQVHKPTDDPASVYISVYANIYSINTMAIPLIYLILM